MVVRDREELAAARKGLDVRPALVANKERKVAEWVLKNGGNVTVDCDGMAIHHLGDAAKLPGRPFKVAWIGLDQKKSRKMPLSRTWAALIPSKC